MRTQSIILSLLILALGIYSCSTTDPEALRLIEPLPTGVVSQSAVLKFAFSRALVPPESTNVWMNTQYIEFTPAIEGKFVWQDTSKLVFSPDAALPGDTKFKGRLNGKLLAATARAKKFQGDEDFSFATDPFTMKSAEFFYDRIDNKRTVGIKANLEFTYAVDPNEVEKYIKITLDGEELHGFKVMSSAVNKIVPLEIGTVIQFGKEREIKVSFEDKLISTETKTVITLEKPFVFKLPALDDLRIYGHEFGFDGTESWIRIKTSQEVDIASVKPYVVLDPSRTFTLDAESKLSFKLKGKFEPGTAFHLTIKKGFESILGAKTQNDYDADIVIGNVTPSFRFGSSGSYMLLNGLRSVEIKTVNMSELKVRVSQVFQNNLVHFLNGGRQYDSYYGDEEDEGSYHYQKYRFYLGNYGRVIEEKKIAINNAINEEVTTLFDLTPFLQTDYKGFYLIEVAKTDESWRWTSKLVSLSDIGLIVKRSGQELITFAVGLNDNKPMSGVQVNLISTNNQTMASAKTDGDGLAKFYNFGDLSKNFTLKLVTAEQGDDFNFINLSDYRVETSRFDVSGKNDMHGMFDAFLYGDRNLYRPGEKIYVTGIVRNLTNALPENMPIRIKVYNPRGFMVTELRQNLNEQGSFEINYQTLETAQTGEYRFDLHTGDDVFLTSYKTSVEDFVPDRLKVTLKPSMESAKPGDKVQYDLLALNFFGPPASGRNVEFEATFEQQPYVSKRFPEFRFSDDGAAAYSANPYVEKLETDKDGKGNVTFVIPKEVTAQGVLSLKGLVSVFDESGRPVHQVVRTTVFPKEYFIGVRSFLDYYVAPNSPLKIQMIAIDAANKPINNFNAHVEIIRHEWHSVLRMNSQNNALRYVSEQREIVEQTKDVLLKDTSNDFTFSVQRSGDYIVRVSKAGGTGYNQIGFYAYSWGSTDLTSFEIDPEARVDIVLDKETYAPGDKAKILFKTPFSGKLLVTVERNKIFNYRYLDAEKNSASMVLDVEESFLPNVYISAVLFRKVKDLNIPLMSGHGFEPLMVEKPSNKLNVIIDAPEKIRPRTKQKVAIRIPNEKNVYLTLAAVDEGICQVKNYRTPEPYGYFYAKKALETETFDFFRDLIPEPKKSSTGGSDFEAKRSLQINPLSVKRFKPVALWSGIVKTNSDGYAEVMLNIPDFSGELRLMVLAYKNDRFGSSQKGMKVADPVVLSPALPRFLSPGDVITMPVTAFNTTDKPVSLKLEIVTEGAVIAEQQSAALDLQPNEEHFVNIKLKASEQIGKAVVKVRTRAFGEKLECVTELAVRPISPFITETVDGFVDAGKPITMDIPDLFLPFNRRGHVVSKSIPGCELCKRTQESCRLSTWMSGTNNLESISANLSP